MVLNMIGAEKLQILRITVMLEMETKTASKEEL
jgi:hypothetical protein